MRATAYVGRVGGLAVALGIGAATGGLGVAWAAPADSDSSTSADSSASSMSDAPGRPVTRSRDGRAARGASVSAEAGRVGNATGGSSLAGVSPAGKDTYAKTRQALGAGPSVTTRSSSSVEPVSPDRLQPAAVAAISAAAQSSSVVPAAVTSAEGDEAVLVVPVSVAPVAAAPRVVATPARRAAVGGVVKTALAPAVGTSPSAPVGSPVGSPMSWLMAAAARRELGSPAAAQGTGGVPSAAPLREASAVSTITLKDELDISFNGLNSSIGWVPVVGTAINAVKFAIDAISLASSVIALDFPQVITEFGNLVVDLIGLVPVVGAPVASLLYQTVLGGNVKLGALVQGSLQDSLNVDSTFSQYQFNVDAVDVAIGLGGSHAAIATVSKPNYAGVGVVVDITNNGFETGWSVPFDGGRLQLLRLAFS